MNSTIIFKIVMHGVVERPQFPNLPHSILFLPIMLGLSKRKTVGFLLGGIKKLWAKQVIDSK